MRLWQEERGVPDTIGQLLGDCLVSSHSRCDSPVAYSSPVGLFAICTIPWASFSVFSSYLKLRSGSRLGHTEYIFLWVERPGIEVFVRTSCTCSRPMLPTEDRAFGFGLFSVRCFSLGDCRRSCYYLGFDANRMFSQMDWSTIKEWRNSLGC